MIPKTTTIGSYPTFPKPEDIDYYLTMASHGLAEDVVDPYLWSIDEALEDFASAGIEVPSTGQSRGDLYSLFLDPKFVKGIRWNGAEAFVDDRISRLGSNRLADVLHARSTLPSHYEIKEPITDAYTLARFAKINTGAYASTEELAVEINRKIVIPEIQQLQDSGAVSWIQLDSPAVASDSFTPDYFVGLYEEVASAARLPVVLHACGDASRVFPSLIRTKVHTISLDFYHYPRLVDEVSRRNYDQLIGLGCTDSQSLRIETSEETAKMIEFARSRLGEERVQFVHPHCGQRNLNREVAYAKNVALTIARDDVYFGRPTEAGPSRLALREYDPHGYFLVSILRETKEILVTYYSYQHVPKKRYKSKSAERIFQTLNEEADDLGLSRRHLAYLTLELGRAEASLQSGAPVYRQKVID